MTDIEQPVKRKRAPGAGRKLGYRSPKPVGGAVQPYLDRDTLDFYASHGGNKTIVQLAVDFKRVSRSAAGQCPDCGAVLTVDHKCITYKGE